MSRLHGCAFALFISTVALVAAIPSAGVADTYVGQSGTLHVSPPSVALGGQVTASGSGFAPGASVSLTVHSSEVGLGSAVANASGSFTSTVTVPEAAAVGRHEFRAVGQASQGGTLTLTSRLTISGGSAGPLAFTGSRTVIPLGLTGMGLIVLGGMALLTVRWRRKPI